jgi:hypothetical protein
MVTKLYQKIRDLFLGILCLIVLAMIAIPILILWIDEKLDPENEEMDYY